MGEREIYPIAANIKRLQSILDMEREALAEYLSARRDEGATLDVLAVEVGMTKQRVSQLIIRYRRKHGHGGQEET